MMSRKPDPRSLARVGSLEEDLEDKPWDAEDQDTQPAWHLENHEAGLEQRRWGGGPRPGYLHPVSSLGVDTAPEPADPDHDPAGGPLTEEGAAGEQPTGSEDHRSEVEVPIAEEEPPVGDEPGTGREEIAIAQPTDTQVDEPVRDTGTGMWGTAVPPDVVRSCGLALRRMGHMDSGCIAVTSTSEREGRTTVALGLAVAGSVELRRRTILLDLDLNRRDLGRIAPAPSGPGVVDFLEGSARVDELLQPLGSGVSLVTAGRGKELSDPSVSTARLAELVRLLAERSDLLIADLPPLSAGVTAARMADLFDAVTLVIRAGGVALAQIEHATSVLNQRPFVILNGTAPVRRSLLRRLLGLRP